MKRKSVDITQNNSVCGDSICNKVSRKINPSPGDTTNSDKDILRSWVPIYFCKVYTNHSIATMMCIYLLLPSGVKDSTVKVDIVGKHLKLTVVMPGIMESGELIYGHILSTEEYMICKVEYNKILSEIHKRGERM